MSVATGPKIPIMVSAALGDGYLTAGNTMLRALQSLVQPNVKNMTTTTPPVSPSNGDMYVVAAGGTGAWTGKDNQIAYWSTDNLNAPSGEWEFYAPKTGWVVGNQADAKLYIYNGTSWALASPTSAGSISIASVENTGAVGSTPINLSTEGAVDWYAITGTSYALPADATSHSKVMGGWLKKFFYCAGPLGTIANNSGSTTTPWTWTTTAGDDDTAATATVDNNILNGLNNAGGLRSNTNASIITGGFGFHSIAPGKAGTRTLNLYIGFQSGAAATNNSMVISAKLADDSATPRTLTITPGDVNTHWYKVTITYNGSAGAVPLVFSVMASQQTPDTNTFVYLGAMSCF